MRTIITMAAAVLLLAGCGQSTAEPEPQESAAGSITIAGQLKLFGTGNLRQIAQGRDEPPTCAGINGYDDLKEGAPVVVTDQAGAVVATGAVTSSETPSGRVCWLRFSLEAPSGLPFYGIAVGSREPVMLSAQEVTQPVELSIGS